MLPYFLFFFFFFFGDFYLRCCFHILQMTIFYRFDTVVQCSFNSICLESKFSELSFDAGVLFADEFFPDVNLFKGFLVFDIVVVVVVIVVNLLVVTV